MELNEFAIEFLENATISEEYEELSQEDTITRDILEYIIDCGEVLEPEICHYKVRGLKINAYSYDDENDTMDLFITICKRDKKLMKVSDNEITDAYKKAYNFFESAKEGKLNNKVDESENRVFELVRILEYAKETIKNLRIFVLTNGLASVNTIPESFEESGIYIEYQLWDIERIHHQYLIRSDKQKIEIDFLNDYQHKLKCLHMDRVSDKVDSYLTIIPGNILASIYKKYRQGLLEKNVRTFLQFKAKVNQGIRDTIKKEPDMFFAYNNGISTTAENIEIIYEDNTPYIHKIYNWQIVNGGQTTASIFATSNEKDVDLSGVNVQMKISVLDKDNGVEEIVRKISRYANSQTAIKDSDFSSNSQYHIDVEKFSRTEWVPTNTGGRATNKWFYERTRGQYLDEKSKRTTMTETKKFDIEYPRRQKFTKTDLAKFEMSWWQKPYEVSKGAEKNFKIFTKDMETDKIIIDVNYYYRLIAKAILFKEIDKIVYKRSLGGYKANMVSYILSWLSYKSDKKFDLLKIWETQKISETLNDLLNQAIDIVWEHINNPSRKGMNIGEWCKKQECWISLKNKNFDISMVKDEFLSGNLNYLERDLAGQLLTPNETKTIEETSKVSAETWFSIAKWAKDNDRLTPFDRKLVYNLGILTNRRKSFSPKQAKVGLRILNTAQDEGFVLK